MYVVIVGAGAVGVAVARWLLAAEHEVTVIDREPTRCEALDEELGSISVVGDGTVAAVLAKAGANRADIFIAMTGNDDENMVACQLAKHRFGASRTISMVTAQDHETLFNRLGIDVTVNTTALAVAKVQQELSGSLLEEAGATG